MSPASWRPRYASEALPPVPSVYGGFIPSYLRCHALGLGLGSKKGDCVQFRVDGSYYCYYHDKVQRGVLEPEHHLYPVWPLPSKGYVLMEEEVA